MHDDFVCGFRKPAFFRQAHGLAAAIFEELCSRCRHEESIDICIDVGNRFESVEKSVGQLLDVLEENGWRARCEKFRTALRSGQ